MNMAKELAALKQLGVSALRTRYAEVFGEDTRAGSQVFTESGESGAALTHSTGAASMS
jgi:hypothetical protein